jgi:divalent metal cation (Fe/Co/Zn/Cd) transporter
MTTSKLKDITFILFFGVSVIIIIGYFVLLFNKITRPSFQDLQTDDFIWLGIVIIGFIATDVLIIRRFRRRSKKKGV